MSDVPVPFFVFTGGGVRRECAAVTGNHSHHCADAGACMALRERRMSMAALFMGNSALGA